MALSLKRSRLFKQRFETDPALVLLGESGKIGASLPVEPAFWPSGISLVTL